MLKDLPLVCIDFETDRISTHARYPSPVCMAVRDESNGRHELLVVGEHDVEGELRSIIQRAMDHECRLINQYLAWDMRVAVNEWPELLPYVLWLYEQGAVGDPSHREKYLNLANHGMVAYEPLPDGSTAKVEYSMASLVMRRFGQDISAGKKGPDSWRLRYGELRGVPLRRWPQEAVDYPLSDVYWPIALWRQQTGLILPDETWPVEVDLGGSEAINLRVDFVHTGVTDRGLVIDPEQSQVVWSEAEEAMAIENFPLLVRRGIIRPEIPPMPYKKGTLNPDGTPKMKRAVKESVNKGRLLSHVIAEARRLGIRIDLTEKGIEGYQAVYGERKLSVPAIHECFTNYPKWATAGKGTIGALAESGEPIAEEMQKRAKVEKLVTSYFPGLVWDYGHGITGKKAIAFQNGTKLPPPTWKKENADIRWATTVHPDFDLLKDSGRSSSRGGDLYPSVNIHQVDPRIRSCYIARPGYILVAIDFAALELFSAAWTWKRLLGHSVLYDLLCEGLDPHGYLAAQLSYLSDPESIVWGETPRERYDYFRQWKDCEEDTVEGAYYKKWRKLAKAVGLGFPGGLGIAKFIVFAWQNHGVRVTQEEAAKARAIWMQTFPEAREYLKDWITTYAVDPQWNGLEFNVEGKVINKFRYTSPCGMVRSNCIYTECANGNALQTPSGEGFKIAEWWVYLETMNPESAMYGSHVVAPIHDEIVYEIPIFVDYSLTNAAILKAQSVMELAMQEVLTGMPVRTEAAAMYRWNKGAKPHYSEEGWLVPSDPYPHELYESLSLQ